jgi:ABC-type amino acid transport substrate-binding protein
MLSVSSLANAKADFRFAAIEHLFEQQVGIAVLEEVYKKLGYQIEVASYPARRAQVEAANGMVDGEVMRIWSYGEQNPQLIRVPTPYYSLNTTAFFNKESQLTVTSLSDLSSYKIVVVRGVKHTADVTDGLVDVEHLSSSDKLMHFVLRGRADLALTNKMDGLLNIRKLKLGEQMSYSPPLAVFPLYHYIHQSQQQLVDKVDRVIISMLRSGELARIIQQTEQKLLNSH